MASVDDRIVRMEFDNAAFEKKLSDTLKSLNDLEKALKFEGASKGLSDVSSAANNVNFNGMSSGIEGISAKFIALSTIAITVLAGITTKAVSAGAQIAKEFSIQPIIDGFHEYETQLNSVQTILANTASKGTTLDQVNAALQQLNTYSDQTIYNFSEMARNIGTFTAAGVDLDTSVQSIKGIANLAAMSGSSADQASTAMYQLSQAIASGSVHLMDWNSVVNAGMGGEAFQSALFNTSKAMGNVLNIPVDQTFQQWKDAGNSFRDSLQEGWITADVLTTTLGAFSGDITEEMLLAKGFTQDQATEITRTAAIAKAAATQVKTFTQLVGTVKEAVGSGWTESFQLIIGNFTQAKELWTGVNNSIGAFVQQNAAARNAILQGWQDMGGRGLLIMSLQTAFRDLAAVLKPIKEAFQSMFPPMTVDRLLAMTQAFARLTVALQPAPETIDKIRRIFSGLFAVLSIGWEVLKEGAKFLANLVKELLHLVDAPGITEFIAKIGDGLVSLQNSLVKGGGIKAFFAGLGKVLQEPISFLEKIRNALGDVFGLFDKEAPQAVGDSLSRMGDRFQSVKDIFAKVSDFLSPLSDFFDKAKEIFGKVKTAVEDFVSNLGNTFSDALSNTDFSQALDALNTGFLAGITLLLVKFLKNGFNIGFNSIFSVGGGEFFDTITNTFGQLTSTLQAMQTNIKASALLKIASAIGILTASVLVLSLINSEALTRALTAMAVGFGQLMGSFAVLTKLADSPKSAASFTLLSAGLILLSSAILVLSLATAALAKLSWEELARGLGGITGLLAILIVTTKPLAANSKGMITAGIGLTALAVALTGMAVAVALFGHMDVETLAKGLASVGLLVAGIGLALNLMPPGPFVIAQGAALVAVAVALNILAGAVALFGHMNWETLGKGFLSIAAGLLIIAGAMNLMPANLPLTAAGLVLVGFALNEIAAAMKIMGSMKWDEIARGLVALAGSMTIIAIAMNLMTGAIPGAIALGIVAVSLGVLAGVLKVFGKIKFSDLLVSLGQMGVALAAIAAASLLLEPALPAILGLGVALSLLGAGFALFGAGVFLIGKGLEAIAQAGDNAAAALLNVLKTIAKALPELAASAASGVLDFLEVLTKGAPVLVKFLGLLLGGLLDETAKLIPKIGEVVSLLIVELIRVVKTYVQQYIDLGIYIITQFLSGINDNIGQITTTVGQIVVNFINAIGVQVPAIIQALSTTIINVVTTASEEIGRVSATLMFGCAVAFMNGFLEGVGQILDGPIANRFLNMVGDILGWIGDTASRLYQKGVDLLQGLLNGAVSMIQSVFNFFLNIGDGIWQQIKNPLGILEDIGEKIIQGLWNGMKSVWHHVEDWLGGLGDAIGNLKGPPKRDAILLVDNGMLIMQGLQNGMQSEWENVATWLSQINPADDLDKGLSRNMSRILSNVVNQMGTISEFSPTITPVLDLTEIAKGASKIGDYIQTSPVVPTVSFAQAQTIATDRTQVDTSSSDPGQSGGVKFEQNIYAPTELSTSAIYKNTRNQITMAKEVLSIP